MKCGALQRTALIYDLDGTLAAGNGRSTASFPLGMSDEAFWRESNACAQWRTRTRPWPACARVG